MISERLLHFIWQFQYFNKEQLYTSSGMLLQVLHGGTHNHNQGPDFLSAKIRLDGIILAGNIELHVLASHWYQHHHDGDDNYAHIILHVVWMEDKPVTDKNHQPIPTLELQPRVAKILLEQYNRLMHTTAFIPCEKQLPVLNEIAWAAWKERLALERLESKATVFVQQLEKTNNHWEEIFWQQLAGNFGMSVNTEIFRNIARSLPVNMLAKYKQQPLQLEALLMGQAGLLQVSFTDPYPVMLQREYRFLAKKHHLIPVVTPPAFLRMRPANFPTVRMAQLAMLVHRSSHLFSKIQSATSVQTVKQLFDVTANDYWHYHYRFEEETGYQPKSTGELFIHNLLINTVIPALFAYGITNREDKWKTLSLQWLQDIPGEKNAVTKKWVAAAVSNDAAFDSQALIELQKNYCYNKRCLECAVGNKLMRDK